MLNYLCLFALAFFSIVDHGFALDKKIVLATDSWPPFYSPKLQQNGFVAEIVQRAFKEVGYDCKIEFVPWARALKYSQSGHYDGLLGAFFSVERTKQYLYSVPVAEINLAFFAKANRRITYQSLKDLVNYKIGIIRGYRYSKEFDTADYLIKKEVSSVDKNVEKLLRDRIDLFLGSKEVVQWALQVNHWDTRNQIKMIEPIYRVNNLYVPISKKRANFKQIVKDFNNGLKIIKSNGVYDKIMQSHGM